MDYTQRVLSFGQSAARVESFARALNISPTLHPPAIASERAHRGLVAAAHRRAMP